MLAHNPVLAAKHASLTAPAGAGSRPAGPGAARAQRARARVACAASLLRWICSLVVHSTSRDPDVAWGASTCPAEAA
jgi:hypothetical protein